MAITYLAGGRILDQQFGAVAPTVPSTYYLALSTTTPADDGTNFTEPSTSGTAYARVSVVNDKATNWNDAAANALTNKAAFTFPAATGAGWGTITHVGIYDSATVGAGNLLYFAALTPSRLVDVGTTVYFDIGDVTVSITN